MNVSRILFNSTFILDDQPHWNKKLRSFYPIRELQLQVSSFDYKIYPYSTINNSEPLRLENILYCIVIYNTEMLRKYTFSGFDMKF